MNDGISRGRVLEMAAAATIWLVAMAILACLHVLRSEEAFTPRALALVFIFGLGGLTGSLLAWPLALWTADRRKAATARFAALFLLLGLATTGATALFYFLQFRLYYAAFHQTPLSRDWVLETLMTGANAGYLFAIDGTRILLPAGLPLLIAAALIFVRRRSREDRRAD
ncbi:hypothetical protein [Pannonibacter sp.]|uniref:hypothetical protein n=1 Tax=Pannonibacter sp. TaxID=1906786 RepID=UPI003F705D53